MAQDIPEPDRTTYDEARNGAAAYLQSRLAAKDPTTDEDFEIPVIDLWLSLSEDISHRKVVAAEIRRACTTSGFFYITNHCIAGSACDDILHQAERFMHELPLSKKQELHLKNNKFGMGWEPSEYTSIAGDKEEKEVFNFAYEPELDLYESDGQYKNLDGSTGKANMWPKEDDLPGFHKGIKDYYSLILATSRHLIRLFALSLDLPQDYFDPMTTHPGGIARLLYYPPSKHPIFTDASTKLDEPIGLGAHSDYELFTLLLTSTTPGLEILKPSGQWHIAKHVPHALIVNVGDFLMRLTNGLYKSTVHRVVNRSTEARYSVPFFFSFNYDAVVEPLPACLGEGEESKWKPIRAGEYILERLNATTAYGAGFQEGAV